jgi:hypothetical protein
MGESTPADLKRRILDATAREPSPTRGLAARRLARVVGAAVMADAALFFLAGGSHLGGRPLGLVAITLGGSALLALAAMVVAFGRGHSMLGRPRRWLLHVTVATPILLMGWTLFWNACYPVDLPGRVGLRCLGLSLLFGGLPLALIARVRRERNPVTPAAAGAARGAAIGALAWVLVGLWCPLENPSHLALGHCLPVLLLAGLGSWLGHRLTSVEAKYSLHVI